MVLRLAALLRLLLPLGVVVLLRVAIALLPARADGAAKAMLVLRPSRACVTRLGCVRGLLARLRGLLLGVCFHGAGMTKGVPPLNSKAAVRANFQQHVLVAAKLYC